MYAAAATSASGAANTGAPPPTRAAVIYRSSALAATAPALVSAVDSRESARVPAIAKAHALAESVREQFKKRGRGRKGAAGAAASSAADAAAGSEEAEKAGRYDRRLKMNRQSAAASRVRREAYIKALEAELVKEDKRGRDLEAALLAERALSARLREEMAANSNRPAPAPPAPPDVLAAPAPAPAPEMEITEADFMAQTANFVDLPVPVAAGPVLDLDNLVQLDGHVKYEPETMPLPLLSDAFLTEAQLPAKNEFSGLDFAEAPFPFTEVDPKDPAAAIEELMNLSVGS